MTPGIFPLIMVLSTGFVFLGFVIEGAFFYFLYKKYVYFRIYDEKN